MSVKSTSAPAGRVAVTATVQRVGKLLKVLAGDSNAAIADLRTTLTGGTARTPSRAEFVVSLNSKVASEGTAQLIDETAASAPVPARKSGNKYVFGPVQFAEPGPGARRVFRITNIRGNASQIGVSSTLVPTPVTASISISSATGISLVNSEQAVASVIRP